MLHFIWQVFINDPASIPTDLNWIHK